MMVVLTHSPKPYAADGYILSGISLLTAPCIGLFFMVSGALLLPVTVPTKLFLKQRLKKIVLPLLFWSLLYMAVDYGETGNTESFGRMLLSLPFSVQGNGVFWFIYVLIGLYFLAPVISPWLQKITRRELEFFLSFWLATMCYPLLRSFIDIDQKDTGILYYFSGYAGYFLLGYYLRHYAGRLPKGLQAVMLLLPPGIAAVCKTAGIELDFYDVFGYLSVMVAMMCVAWFVIIKQGTEKSRARNAVMRKMLTNFSNYSFGIYLIHIFIVRGVLWKFNLELIPHGGGIAETFVLGTVLSYAAIYLIAGIPKAEYLIGYRRK